MARSRDFRKYIIVTKSYDWGIHKYDNGKNEELPREVKRIVDEDKNKTFWMFNRQTGELIGRYSVLSAPQWVMEVYKILVEDDVE